MKRLKQKYHLLLLLFLPILMYTQVSISGYVKYKNKGLKDVSVSIKDSYDGATTDEKGFFTFQTSEKGTHILVFSNSKYVEVEKTIDIETQSLTLNIELKEKINEIDAVVISAGSIEASDKKRATVLLSPIDIYTTPGADGQITYALNYLPGVQKVGESDGLFIRGGTGTETKIFMDGSLINNFYTKSVPGIAGRDRFNTSLFKGNVFSSGGYSALYGQALSGILILESVDLPDKSSLDFGISPIFLSGGLQELSPKGNASFGVSAAYSNLGIMQKLLNFNTNFTKAPEGFNSDANFRIKTKFGGFLKYYGSYDTNTMAVIYPNLEDANANTQNNLLANNTYHNLSFKQKWGKYLLNLGSSFAYNQSNLEQTNIKNLTSTPLVNLNQKGEYFNTKVVLEKKIKAISAVRTGLEFNNTLETNNYNKNYRDLISAAFLETDLGFSNRFSTKIGLRLEHSSYLKKTNVAPRFALAYKISNNWVGSFAYGLFYQNPESKYINSDASLNFQKANHYILQLQRSFNDRSFRLEAYYKNYQNLEKTTGNYNFQTAINNNGNGFAKGIEFFWRDKKTFKNIDYWISYSYIDTKRNFLNYPQTLTPDFASKNTLSMVVKKFVTTWKTGFNISYLYNTGRPYYDIAFQNGINTIRQQGKAKDYNALNFSVNYLPNLGKRDAKSFSVIVLSINNILGSKNIYSYQFSNNGSQKLALLPPVNTFVFLGWFISFGTDKTQDAINNNL